MRCYDPDYEDYKYRKRFGCPNCGSTRTEAINADHEYLEKRGCKNCDHVWIGYQD